MNRIILFLIMVLTLPCAFVQAEPATNLQQDSIPQTNSFQEDDALKQELFALYQRSKDLKQFKDEKDYKTVFSQAMADKLNRTIDQLPLGSFKDYLARMASFEIDMSQWTLLPQYVEQNQDKAVLIILCPQAAGWESPGGLGLTEDTVIRVAYIKEDAQWKINGKEELAVKPSWMGIKTFMLSQKETNFSDPSQWSTNYVDPTKEDQGAVHDISKLFISHDENFIYLKIVYLNLPSTSDPELLIYFDTDQDSSTGNQTREHFVPKIAGWERRLELKASPLRDPEYPFAFEVVAGELGVQRTAVYFEQKNKWIRLNDHELFLKIPFESLGLSAQKTFDFIVVSSWSGLKNPEANNLKGSYHLTLVSD